MSSASGSDSSSFSTGSSCEAPAPGGQPSSGPPADLLRSQRDAKTVFIADQDRVLLNILSARCRRMGLKVLAAHDATTAMAIIRMRPPQVICLDVQMSGDDGRKLCETIASDQSFEAIPLVILTGAADPETVILCNSIGAYYVEKCPEIWARLEPLLKELLENPLVPPADEAGAVSQTSTCPADCEQPSSIATSEALGTAEFQPSTAFALPNAETQDEGAEDHSISEPIIVNQVEVAASFGPPDSPSETEQDEAPETIEIESELPDATETVWTHITQAVERLLTRTGGPDQDESLTPTASTPIMADVPDDQVAATVPFESLLLSDEIAIPESTDVVDPDAARIQAESEHTLPVPEERPPFRPTMNEAARMIDLDKAWTTIGKGKTASKAPLRPRRDTSKSQDSKGEDEKTILIADDDGDLVQMLALRCAEMGFHVFRSPDAMHALLGVNRIRPHLVILDINMPGGNGLSVCEMLAGDETLVKIPVIIMTGDSNEETVRRCRMLHAEYVPKGPGLWERLEPVMRRALGLSPPEPNEMSSDKIAETNSDRRRPTILCIDDDPEISKILKFRLERYGVDVLRAFNGMQGYWTALDMRPDMIILDMVMPDGSGNYIFGRLRSHPLTEKIPVLMLTGVNTPGVRRQMFALGVDAYLTKPLDFIALLELVRQYVPLCDPKPATEPRLAGDSRKDAVTEFLVAN